MRERMAYLIMIGMFIVLVVFVLAVIGKGVYQPPPEEREQGSIRSEALIVFASVGYAVPMYRNGLTVPGERTMFYLKLRSEAGKGREAASGHRHSRGGALPESLARRFVSAGKGRA